MSDTYVIHAKTDGSSMSVGTEDPADALRRAKEMATQKSTVTISDRSGNLHTIEELEANIASGKYEKPASAGHG